MTFISFLYRGTRAAEDQLYLKTSLYWLLKYINILSKYNGPILIFIASKFVDTL